MKYMGSKRWMLLNGLGHLLRDEVSRASRFIDLFTGSGVVAAFVAQQFDVEVTAFDLQEFCTTLAGAVINRVEAVDSKPLWDAWYRRAYRRIVYHRRKGSVSKSLPPMSRFTRRYVLDMRETCSADNQFPLTKAYGGYYFSRSQVLWIDALRVCLPEKDPERCVALAALLHAASQCAASPGHTAQPFSPTRSAKPFLYDAWTRNVVHRTKVALANICKQHARIPGKTTCGDANKAACALRENDVVFIDLPYSGVHYSRFYHVLETIARGECGKVSGTGRYPPSSERPRSEYSIISRSRQAVSELLEKVAQNGATAIVTFPDKRCSNGISSYLLRKLGREKFRQVEQKLVRGRFSTLGGNGRHRQARQASAELVLVCRP